MRSGCERRPREPQASRRAAPAPRPPQAYSVLINIPGVAVTVENESPAGLFVSNVLFAVGLMTFAVFIGTVADSISTKVEEVRTGNYAIVEKNHSVLIGWNDQAIPLLRQMAIVAKDGAKSSEPETARAAAAAAAAAEYRPQLPRKRAERLREAAAEWTLPSPRNPRRWRS